MAELYTSLKALKEEMNGGVLPPMTAIAASSLTLIDPRFTVAAETGGGMGALVEDGERGMRCPVRGCGGWYHNLVQHLKWKHGEQGGADAVRAALSIPRTASLASESFRNKARKSALNGMAKGTVKPPANIRTASSRSARTKAGKSLSESRRSVNFKNFRNRCENQLAHRLIDLHHKIGRSPGAREAALVYGDGFVTAVKRTFGTWNNAKLQCGLEVQKGAHRYKLESVLEGLRAYYEAHGTLPSSQQATRPNRTPAIPSRSAVLRALEHTTWPDAMRVAASMLGIRGGRYGLPERPQAA